MKDAKMNPSTTFQAFWMLFTLFQTIPNKSPNKSKFFRVPVFQASSLDWFKGMSTGNHGFYPLVN